MHLEPLRDGHGRPIGDLRVSVTDRCNFRCQYCMPAEGLPWLERSEILTFEEIARLVALLASMGVHDVRLTGGEPLVRRDFPRLARCSPRSTDVARPGADDQRLPARARRRGARRRRHRPLQRLGRLAAARPLLRADPPRRAAAGAARARACSRPSRRRTRSRSTRSRCAASPRTRCSRSPSSRAATPYEVRFIEFMPLDADHAWTADQVLTGAECARRSTPSTRSSPSRASQRDRARLPLRRRPRADRLHQPGLRALLRRLQPDPPDRRRAAAHLPVLAERDRPARAAARRRRRRRARADHPRRRLAQGAQAPRRRAGLHPAGADDVRDRRLAPREE